MRKRNASFNCLHCKDRNWLIKCDCSTECNIIIYLRDKYGCQRRFANYHVKKGINHPNKKQGRYLDDRGYWRIYVPDYYRAYSDGSVREHIYFYERFHDVCVLKWTDIHHIDGDTNNNMPWNLEALIHGNHSRLTRTKNRDGIRCSNPVCTNPTKTGIRKSDGRQIWYSNPYKSWLYYCESCAKKYKYYEKKTDRLKLK